VTSPGRQERTLAVAAPPRVATWLRTAPDGPVEVLHACSGVVHLDVAGRCVSIAAAGSPGLPNALRTKHALVSSGRAGTPYLERGILHWGACALMTRRLVDVRAPRFDAAWVPKASPVAAHGSPRPDGAGLVALPGRVDADTVGALIGRGEGLTPLGDDVLCGWLAVHRAAGAPTAAVDEAVRRHLPRTTTLSATLLECALAGEVADPVAAYLRALDTPGATAARDELETLGHSSGLGLAHGIDLGLAELAQGACAA
jgi:hypothetical protein